MAMRDNIFNRNAFNGTTDKPARQNALWWFRNATDFMNQLFTVGSKVKLFIAAETEQSYRSDVFAIIVVGVAFCIMTPFCVLMLKAVLSQLTKENRMECYFQKR